MGGISVYELGAARLDPAGAACDEIIDVRSPSEFAADHAPGAINLPVLDDAERARVGTLYKTVNPFVARKLGAALIARAVAGHLEGHFADKPGGYRPLVYGWRGGQRSHAMATILAEIGWRVSVLEGGYRRYRAGVVQRLYETEVALELVRLDGDTGVGKTLVLRALAEAGAQILDLEALAAHRGSVFGAEPGRTQPAQKLFESRLDQALAALDPKRPVFVEAEANQLGRVSLPPSLWRAMQASGRVVLFATLEARVGAIVRDYAHLTADAGRLSARLNALAPFHPRARLEAWREHAQSGAIAPLVSSLLETHYDKAYARARAGEPEARAVISLDPRDPDSVRAAADAVAGAFALAPV